MRKENGIWDIFYVGSLKNKSHHYSGQGQYGRRQNALFMLILKDLIRLTNFVNFHKIYYEKRNSCIHNRFLRRIKL